MSNWLSKRLTPPKIKEVRWAEFASVLERAWEIYFDPDISRLERLRSCYLADDADLIKQIREMGDYFSFERPQKIDRPISLAWRRLELEYKDMELILMSVFRRHYSNLPVTWFPIFAPIDQVAHPYGTVFETAQGPWPIRKNEPPEDMFLTSRGRLGTDYGRLLAIGLNKADFLAKALPLLRRTKPLHIVYDGALWYIRFDLPFEYDGEGTHWEREGDFELQFSVVGSRFDFTPADVTFLDIQTALCTWERETPFASVIAFPEQYPYWHLDRFLPEGFSQTWLPLDALFHGNESDSKNPCSCIFTREEIQKIPAPEVTASIARELIFSPKINLEADFTRFAYIDRPFWLNAFPDFGPIWHLDRYLPEEFAANNWLPADTLIPGNEADAKNPCALVSILREEKIIFDLGAKIDCQKDRSRWQLCDFEAVSFEMSEIEVPCPIEVKNKPQQLDLYPLFDEIPADFAPLDMPVGGFCYA